MNEVIPFLAVADMTPSLAFYVDGLGFEIEKKWVVDDQIRWCQLRLGRAAVMLQEFATEGHDARRFTGNKGEGVTLCFFPDDAVAFYREAKSRGLAASEPIVSNGLWATELADPDGYQLLIESPASESEGTRLL